MNDFEKVDQQVSIVDVISKYITINKAGKDYKALCPFHADHSPSMSISVERNMYKCFVCGNAGGAIHFVSQFKGIPPVNALKELADTYHIPLEQSYTKNSSSTLFEIMEVSKIYFSDCLFKTEDGLKALNYLHDRGIDNDSINNFGIGYAPKERNVLVNYLKSKGYKLDQMIKVGMVIQNEQADYLDAFYDRIMIPIKNSKGRITGFSGRALGKSDAKYKNTGETPIFTKGETLYNYSDALDSIKEKNYVVLVEGYFDLIRGHIDNVPNIVASMGTSLTKGQIQLIKESTNNVILSYDFDSPGILANLKAALLFKKEEINTKVCVLDLNLDPDEYVLKNGIGSYKNAIKNKISLEEFIENYALDIIRSKEGVEREDLEKILKELYNKKIIPISKISTKYLNTISNEKLTLISTTIFSKDNLSILLNYQTSESIFNEIDYKEFMKDLVNYYSKKDTDDKNDKITNYLGESSLKVYNLIVTNGLYQVAKDYTPSKIHEILENLDAQIGIIREIEDLEHKIDKGIKREANVKRLSDLKMRFKKIGGKNE